MPAYIWGPSGGYRVVYEYANQLVNRGHEVSVVHPRQLAFSHPENPTLRQRLRKIRLTVKEALVTPKVHWHPIDPRVRLRFVPSLAEKYLPDADILFATAWNTVRPVMKCSAIKGEKVYLIQGYETWLGPQNLVDETWRLPLRKIVISRWLLRLGDALGAQQLTYIPNGIDRQHYRVLQPIEHRPRQVVMVCSHVPLKGTKDGIAALELAKQQFPALQVVLFGNSYRPQWIPKWMSYYANPSQAFIVERLYNGSSILLSPSWMEGFGLPPVEAASCGCALVATDNDGHREYIHNGVTGLLSAPKDPQALGQNLCALLADDDLRTRLALAANRFVQRYDWQRSANLMEAFLLQTLKRRPRRDETIPAGPSQLDVIPKTSDVPDAQAIPD